MDTQTTDQPTGPSRARAVFSSEDFKLLRDAVLSHLKRDDIQDSPVSVKFSNLYHRLGRLG
ncbi:hypothetical protein GGR88_002689 [Sphingomonas jejuensis]|uniref:Uncharacterized protein n=1 Tax=Sphingomonas jejuensis TaxID=904715 RepID=A0ABX0XPL2_9SPHN|nr:hypothetical protein [Sphingomonas jejuensis]NJC35175.1 hypothetical protein [Sphingomonas jejuensis]